MIRPLTASIALLTLALPAAAQEGGPTLENIVSLRGSCDELTVAGRDLSDVCQGVVLQTIYSNGRNGFYLATEDGKTIVTFSGFDGESPGPDEVVQELDMVISGESGAEPASVQVSGTCLYGNPYNGEMEIACDATGPDDETYTLRFTTDGSEPELMGDSN